MSHSRSCGRKNAGGHDRLYAQAFRLAGIGAWECDIETEQLIWTDGVYDLFEWDADAPLKRESIVNLYCDESRGDMETMRSEAIRTGQSFTMDAKIRTLRGKERWIRLSAGAGYEDGRLVRLFGAKQNVTAQIEVLNRLKELAEHDALTGLANRGAFEARYDQVTSDEVNHGHVSALALIDLDHFKQINDKLGHQAGDECLRQVAMRLSQVFSGAVQVARIGGDEFAVFLPARLDPAEIAVLLERASRALRKPIFWHGHRLPVSASIGVAILARAGVTNLRGLFTDADAALYIAKTAGRNKVYFWGEDGGSRHNACLAG